MKLGLQARMERLFNRHGDGRAVCVAADHGFMSDVTQNVVFVNSIVESVIDGGIDGILLSPGQAMRLAPLFRGRQGPALIVRADWMNVPRLNVASVSNAVPQQKLVNEIVITAEQALAIGATASTIYLFVGYNDEVEAVGINKCTRFVNECRRAGLPCAVELIAYGKQVSETNVADILTLGARMAVEIGADAVKIPYTGNINTFRQLVEVSDIPILVLGGEHLKEDKDVIEFYSEAQKAGASGCLMGRNVTKSANPQRLVEQLTGIAHHGWTIDKALYNDQ